MNTMGKFIGLLILACVILLVGGGWWLISPQMSTYVPLNSGFKIAQICAIATKKPHEMDVSVTLFDSAGKATSNQYSVQGDILLLRGDIIKPFMNLFVLHSGYKLVALEGHYQDPTLEKTNKPYIIPLNGGHDTLFSMVQWLPASVVQATDDSPLPVPVNGKTYNVFVPQNTPLSPVLNAPPCDPHL